MTTQWHESNGLWYLVELPIRKENQFAFIGAFSPTRFRVYRQNGTHIQYLPDDLILDEALAVAKIIIMTDRSILNELPK